MNMLRSIILLDFKVLGWNARKLLWLQVGLLLTFLTVSVVYSYNFDWKRWISLGAFLLAMKVGLDVALSFVNIKTKSAFKIKELASLLEYNRSPERKAASKYLGKALIVLSVFVVAFLFGSHAFLKYQIDTNGVAAKGVMEEMYWRNSPSKKNAGFYMDYCYRVDGKKYQNRARVGRKSNIAAIKVRYLPYAPNIHKVNFPMK
ncbi:MAG: hypothetical protein Crog4KO_06360 [Crocinitomicaceae bacterium]